MIASIPPLAILLEKGPAMFAFDFGRYLVAASVTSAVVWGLRRSSIAARKIQAAGLANRISAQPLDFFNDPLPRADVITMGMILHDWNLEKKKHLVKAAYDALPAGGAFVAIENIIDDARRQNAFGLMMSLNMLIEFGEAFDFTGADFDRWCREAGFRKTEIMHLAGPASAAIAYK